MVEAVPSRPYGAYEDINDLLKCYNKMKKRRQILNDFFKKKHNLTLTSFATPLILGTKDHIDLNDPKLEEEIKEYEGRLAERNEYSRSDFAIDGTENPHPRFPGLMKSIR